MKDKKNQKGSGYTFYFDDRLKQELEKLAKEEDRTMSWMINTAVKQFLERRKR